MNRKTVLTLICSRAMEAGRSEGTFSFMLLAADHRISQEDWLTRLGRQSSHLLSTRQFLRCRERIIKSSPACSKVEHIGRLM